MLRLALFLMIAGCGRIGFDETSRRDATVPPDGLPAAFVEYPMDDDPSTGTVASIPAGLEGSCTSCPAGSAPGKLGSAYAFDGNVHVVLPSSVSALLGPQPYTVSVWIDYTTQGMSNVNAVLAKPTNMTTNLDVMTLWINWSPAGELAYEITTGTANDVLTAAGTDVRGAWHHVAASSDGMTRSLYLDGVRLGSAPVSPTSSSLPAIVGADLDANAYVLHYHGAIDDLRIYDRALGDTEIAALAAM